MESESEQFAQMCEHAASMLTALASQCQPGKLQFDVAMAPQTIRPLAEIIAAIAGSAK